MPNKHETIFIRSNGNEARVNQSAGSEVLGKVTTVLIVERDPICRNLLREIFSRNDFMVLDAMNHNEGMHLLRVLVDEEIDLLIVSPDANVAADALSRDMMALRPGAKILFTIDGDRDGSSYVAIPGSELLRKPFTEARLLEVVSRLLKPTMQ